MKPPPADQVTAGFVVPVTVAENATVPPGTTSALNGVTRTVTGTGAERTVSDTGNARGEPAAPGAVITMSPEYDAAASPASGCNVTVTRPFSPSVPDEG